MDAAVSVIDPDERRPGYPNDDGGDWISSAPEAAAVESYREGEEEESGGEEFRETGMSTAYGIAEGEIGRDSFSDANPDGSGDAAGGGKGPTGRGAPYDEHTDKNLHGARRSVFAMLLQLLRYKSNAVSFPIIVSSCLT